MHRTSKCCRQLFTEIVLKATVVIQKVGSAPTEIAPFLEATAPQTSGFKSESGPMVFTPLKKKKKIQRSPPVYLAYDLKRTSKGLVIIVLIWLPRNRDTYIFVPILLCVNR